MRLILKNNKMFKALIHVIWIVIMSIVITVFSNEVFSGSKTGNIVGIILIISYVLFSFIKKYQTEKNHTKILEITDTTVTLIGGFFLMTLSREKADSVGLALKDMLNITHSQPPMLLFYIGVLLLIVGIIKVFIINRNRIKYAEPKI
jgi:hypothetical protein